MAKTTSKAPAAGRRVRQRVEARGDAPRTDRELPKKGVARRRADFLAVLCFLVGTLLALALLRKGSAGWLGASGVEVVRFWVGHVVVVCPLLLYGVAFALVVDYRKVLDSQLVWGTLGLLAVVLGWVHLLAMGSALPWDSTLARIENRLNLNWSVNGALVGAADGGALGALVVWALTPLGRLGSFVTLVAVGLASFLLLSDLTLRGLLDRANERSRIAGEQVRLRAEWVNDRARTALASIPARRGQSPFIELSEDDSRPSIEDAQRKKPRALRRVFGDGAGPVPEPSPAILAALSEDPITPAGEDPGRREPRLRGEVAGIAEKSMVPAPEPSAPTEPPVSAQPPAPAEPERVQPRVTLKRAQVARTQRPGAGAADDYVLPPLTLLDAAPSRPKRIAEEAQANISILENTLGQFKIQAQVVEIADGPSVTRYEIRLGEGIRVRKILDLADNIAMSLAAMSVRVEAPIPGKAAIGIEVPKKQPSMVTLRECLESEAATKMASKVGFVLGKDIAGDVQCSDLARMPHLLVAGATNSGKSACLNVLIASMLFRARPDELKLIMIDPKRVELTLFEGIPHLVHPVVKDVKQAAGILRWVLKEMDRRFDLFSEVMTRNIDGYNQKVAKEPDKKLPFLVVIIDELADLMMQQGPEVEQSICRLAQLARATGIHLVIATQRPSVDVITGLIKANVPSRIAFAVTSQIDSRTMLDAKGAESLIGRGDMLFKPVDANKPFRIQGAFLREEEVERMVTHLKSQGKPEYIAEALTVDTGAYGVASEEESEDELFEPAARFVVTTGHASTSMIQRKFKLGYTRAARLVDMMEARGIVGGMDGPRPREILMSRDALDQMFLNVRSSPFRADRGFAPAAADADAEDEDAFEMAETIGPPHDDPFVDE
jgi:S-DNA-T family DNA segregation ATPase FtsK/SpoIIIE